MRTNIEPGGLLTRDERHRLRLISQDLRRQAERCTSEPARARLEQQIANVEMERRNDRESRPRKRGR